MLLVMEDRRGIEQNQLQHKHHATQLNCDSHTDQDKIFLPMKLEELFVTNGSDVVLFVRKYIDQVAVLFMGSGPSTPTIARQAALASRS